MIAVFGANGFVGRELLATLNAQNKNVVGFTRENFESALGREFEYVINAAMPSARFKAKNDPAWDFNESVAKTSKFFYGLKFKKFVQISSVSARCQTDTVYGRHKLAAESIVNDGRSLIVRLGPMYGPSLNKGVLIDMTKGSKVFVSGKSRYGFAPLNFVTNWISKNLDQKGIWEVGAKNSIALEDLAKKMNLNIEFEGAEDHQEMQSPQSDYPDVGLVLDYLKGAKA